MTTEQEYRRNPRLNVSTLKLYIQNEASIAYAMELEPNEPSEAMKLGTAVHKLIETNLQYRIPVSPFENFRTKEAQTWKASHPDAMKEEDAMQALSMASRVLGAFPDLRCGSFEVPCYNDHNKALVDYISKDVRYSLDWKTTSATTLDQFRRDANKYLFEMQAAWYMPLAHAQDFYFVGISTAKPHPLFILHACHASLNHGRLLCKKAERIRSEYIAALNNQAEKTIIENLDNNILTNASPLWETS